MPNARAQLEAYVLSSLLYAGRHQFSDALTDPQSVRRLGRIAPVLQYIESNADSDLTPEILAQSGGGQRPQPYTVWAAIRRAAPKPGAHIAVVGIGGLGHFAIQYAKAAGFGVTAVTRTASKAELVRQLGADNVVVRRR